MTFFITLKMYESSDVVKHICLYASLFKKTKTIQMGNFNQWQFMLVT